jgi:hypothetical protein
MTEDGKKMLELMFRKEEYVCCSPDKFGYHSIPLENIYLDQITLVSPNSKVPVKTVDSNKITLVALNPMGWGYRKDSNCSAFRNFLIEMDTHEKHIQVEYIKRLGIPYSAMVWSGSKSVHTLISLSEDLPDEKTYRMLYKWILKLATLSDQALGNPSRSIRLAGGTRPETGNTQELIELKSRVKLDNFMAYLNKYPHLRPKEREERKDLTFQNDYDKLSSWARSQLKDGIDFSKGRNKTYFGLACDLAKSGYSESETIEILEQYFVEEHDFKYREFLTAIKSAHTYMANKG